MIIPFKRVEWHSIFIRSNLKTLTTLIHKSDISPADILLLNAITEFHNRESKVKHFRGSSAQIILNRYFNCQYHLFTLDARDAKRQTGGVVLLVVTMAWIIALFTLLSARIVLTTRVVAIAGN
ncbi:hypothetical protein [Rahnella perminowiae]|uniref:hypothetical protein n=1 Tax=Rahnella perminowiae TaxID=2816244 RepID=UPI00215D4CC1|nr:hypothetical protein [Rahnella perminowiae]MCR9001292.1 hypothetical protein [Rahnella perminowiae]